MLGAFTGPDGDDNAWAWYQSAAALSEATRKMYVETSRTAANNVYYRIADACTGITADALTGTTGGWTASGTSAECAALCSEKQAYYRATGDRDTLSDLAATDDAAAATDNSSTHCFGYKWTADTTGSAGDAICDLGVRYTSFDVVAVAASTTAADNVCMARFASMAVYGTTTATGVEKTGTTTGGKIAARALNGGDGSSAEVGF